MTTVFIDDFNRQLDRGAVPGYDPFANPNIREWITARDLKPDEPGWLRVEDFYWREHPELGKDVFYYSKARVSLIERPEYTVEIRHNKYLGYVKFPDVNSFVSRMSNPGSYQDKLQKKLGHPEHLSLYFADGYTPAVPDIVSFTYLREGDMGWIQSSDMFWEEKGKPFVGDTLTVSTSPRAGYDIPVRAGRLADLTVLFETQEQYDRWEATPGTHRTLYGYSGRFLKGRPVQVEFTTSDN